MAIRKVVLDGTTLIDLSSLTTTASQLFNGEVGINKLGEFIFGTYNPRTVYTGKGEPSSTLGNNDDIYLDMGE